MQGSIIGEKYRLVRKISSGGMGTVYEARHLGTGRRVALKLIRQEPTQTAGSGDRILRFEREARAAGSIDSPHVVQVMDTGVDAASGRPYLVMELLIGEDLRQLLRRARVLPTDLVLRIAAQACLGLARAHERGVIHRDVKAANIFLSRHDKAAVVVKILDFGVAKMREQPWAVVAQELTQSGAVIGSPSYMSPEQALGSRLLDSRSDLWSLGVVMYEALCGSTPHGRELTLGALIVDICSRPAPPLRERAAWVAEEVAAIVHQALALEPSQRFSSALEMHAAILALVADDTIRDSMLVSMLSASGAGSDGCEAGAAAEVERAVVLSGSRGRPEATVDPRTLSGISDGAPRKRHRLPKTGLLLATTAVLLIGGGATRALRPSKAALAPAQSRAAGASSAPLTPGRAPTGRAEVPAVPITRERSAPFDAAEPQRAGPSRLAPIPPSATRSAGPRAPWGLRTGAHSAPADVSAEPQAVVPPPNATIDREF